LRPHRTPDDATDTGRADATDDLPRRVRQASLAPQLRARPAQQPAPPAGPHGDDPRTPELVRDRMTAYRAGWARGGGRQPGHGFDPDPAPGGDGTEGDSA
jgi:hypothetical protein